MKSAKPRVVVLALGVPLLGILWMLLFDPLRRDKAPPTESPASGEDVREEDADDEKAPAAGVESRSSSSEGAAESSPSDDATVLESPTRRIEPDKARTRKRIATRETLGGDAHYIPETEIVEIRNPDGAIEAIEVTRNFSAATISVHTSSDTPPRRREAAPESTRPIQLDQNAFVRQALDLETRSGVYEVALSLHPNVQDTPEEGTIIDLDGAYLGFRIASPEQRTYELVALGIQPSGELDWELVSTYGALAYSDPSLQAQSDEFAAIAGIGAAEWDARRLSITINYDDFTWGLTGADGKMEEARPLLVGADAPTLSVTNGATGSTILLSSEVTRSF